MASSADLKTIASGLSDQVTRGTMEMVVVCDLDLFVVYVSQTSTIKAKDYMLGRCMLDLSKPSSKAKIKRAVAKLLRSQDSTNLTLNLLSSPYQEIRVDAQMFILETHASVMGYAFLVSKIKFRKPRKLGAVIAKGNYLEAQPSFAAVEMTTHLVATSNDPITN